VVEARFKEVSKKKKRQKVEQKGRKEKEECLRVLFFVKKVERS
jgi:hypothetical protein